MPRRRRRRPIPALLTGTSSEFLGRRPWPRVLRSRPVVVILGPEGVGKTSVAEKIAGPRMLRLDTHRLQEALLARVREGSWEAELTEAHVLVLDGPVWLRGRPGVVALLAELVRGRVQKDRKTVLCQQDADGSVAEISAALRPGSVVTIGLRFPTGRRGRIRFARRICDTYGAPHEAARSTDRLEPWRYEKVIEIARRWPDPVRFVDENCALWRRD